MFVFITCKDLESVPLLFFSKPGLCRSLLFLIAPEYFTNYLGHYFHIYYFKTYWLPEDFWYKKQKWCNPGLGELLVQDYER